MVSVTIDDIQLGTTVRREQARARLARAWFARGFFIIIIIEGAHAYTRTEKNKNKSSTATIMLHKNTQFPALWTIIYIYQIQTHFYVKYVFKIIQIFNIYSSILLNLLPGLWFTFNTGYKYRLQALTHSPVCLNLRLKQTYNSYKNTIY